MLTFALAKPISDYNLVSILLIPKEDNLNDFFYKPGTEISIYAPTKSTEDSELNCNVSRLSDKNQLECELKYRH